MGLKGNWHGFSANLAVFEQEIRGFQSNIFTGKGFELGNAGKQSTFGVEFESQAQISREFSASLGVTYLDPKYNDFVYSAVGDLSGTTPAGIPKWTVVVGGAGTAWALAWSADCAGGAAWSAGCVSLSADAPALVSVLLPLS